MRIVALLLAAAFQLAGQSDPSWKPMEFLLGKWTGVAGEKDTQMGAGQGAFSFDLELNKKIVIRRNNATYDSGVKHDDLMVVYFDNPKEAPHAIYFDSEGHVIRYTVAFPAANRAVFESDGTQPGPKYRLTYWMEGGALKGTFEVAPPGAPYQNYMSWTSKR